MNADEARAIFHARRGARGEEPAQTAAVACAWCGAAAHRPCRAPGARAPLPRIHDRRRLDAATRQEARP